MLGISATSSCRTEQEAKNDAARKLIQMMKLSSEENMEPKESTLDRNDGSGENMEPKESTLDRNDGSGENMEPKKSTLDRNDGSLSPDEWDTLQTRKVLEAYLSTRKGILIKKRPTKENRDQKIEDGHLCFKREGQTHSKTLDTMIKRNQVEIGTDPPATLETYKLMETILKELEIDFDIRQLETIGPGEIIGIKLNYIPAICGMGHSLSVNEALYKAAAEVVGTVCNLYM